MEARERGTPVALPRRTGHTTRDVARKFSEYSEARVTSVENLLKHFPNGLTTRQILIRLGDPHLRPISFARYISRSRKIVNIGRPRAARWIHRDHAPQGGQ